MRREAAMTAGYLAGLWVVAATWQSQFGGSAGWATGLGSRYLFPAVPLLAAFAAGPLADASKWSRRLLSAPSLACGYLSAQAGVIPGTAVFPYAMKTWLSGTGMGVLFKEALPLWVGFETLHATVSRPEVSWRDLLHLPPTSEGLVLVRNQAICLGVNLLVLAAVAWLVFRIWQPLPSTAARGDAWHRGVA
jgi:hypothetical protein